MSSRDDTYSAETSPSSETSHDNDNNHNNDRATPPNDTTAPLDVNETPSMRGLRITKTEAVKERVDNATKDLTRRRCIVHNTEHTYAVEYAHVLPRASKDSLLTKLEVSWNMANRTLNVDTRYNIFHLSADMHRMFDGGNWFLIPEQRIVDIFKEKLTKPVREYVTEPTYLYRLVTSKDMIHFPIFRLNGFVPTNPSQMLDLEAGILETFVYPFHNFPPITSHIKPHFVIFQIGEQVVKKASGLRDYIRDNGQHEPILADIMQIYRKWTEPPEPRAEADIDDGGHNDDNDDDDDGDDEDDNDSSHAGTSATRPRRLSKRYLKRSLNEDDGDSEDSRPRRRSRRGSTKRDADVVSLDSRTLLDVEESTCGGNFKTIYVEEWISKVSNETFKGVDLDLEINLEGKRSKFFVATRDNDVKDPGSSGE